MWPKRDSLCHPIVYRTHFFVRIHISTSTYEAPGNAETVRDGGLLLKRKDVQANKQESPAKEVNPGCPGSHQAWWSQRKWCGGVPERSRWGLGGEERGRRAQQSEAGRKRPRPSQSGCRTSERLAREGLWTRQGKAEKEAEGASGEGSRGQSRKDLSVPSWEEWASVHRQWGASHRGSSGTAAFSSEDHFGGSLGDMLEGNDIRDEWRGYCNSPSNASSGSQWRQRQCVGSDGGTSETYLGGRLDGMWWLTEYKRIASQLVQRVGMVWINPTSCSWQQQVTCDVL